MAIEAIPYLGADFSFPWGRSARPVQAPSRPVAALQSNTHRPRLARVVLEAGCLADRHAGGGDELYGAFNRDSGAAQRRLSRPHQPVWCFALLAKRPAWPGWLSFAIGSEGRCVDRLRPCHGPTTFNACAVHGLRAALADQVLHRLPTWPRLFALRSCCGAAAGGRASPRRGGQLLLIWPSGPCRRWGGGTAATGILVRSMAAKPDSIGSFARPSAPKAAMGILERTTRK